MPTSLLYDLDAGRLSRLRRLRWTMIAALVAAVIAVAISWQLPSQRRYQLKVSAGSPLGHRNDFAEALQESTADTRIDIEIVATAGSVETLEAIERGDIDMGFVQGGLGQRVNVRQLAALGPEPLHLLVRSELAEENLQGLKGKTINLSTPGSGTRALAGQVLRFAGLETGDYVDTNLGYKQLQELPPEELPDAIFIVSSLPSKVAEWFIDNREYRLIALPIGGAMGVRRLSISEAQVPAYTYGLAPGVPEEPLETIATQLAFVVREDLPDPVVTRLTEITFSEDFARSANIRRLDPVEATTQTDYKLHHGVETYLRRDQPLITSELVEYIENARSFIVSAAIALFLAYRWYARRLATGFEKYIDRVSHVELEVIQLARSSRLTLDELLDQEARLSNLKSEALDQFASGRLKGDEHLSSFLTHVADVRRMLQGLHAVASS